ncbi:MAG: class I SAM-dependent methyltransferase [bacterium]
MGYPKIASKVLPFIRNKYQIVQCTKCDFYYVHPSIDFSDDEWKQIYDDGYFTKMTDWHYKERIRNLSNRLSRLNKAKNSDSHNFLDLGSGEGLALVEGFSRGWNINGIDINDLRNKSTKNSSTKFITGKFLEVDYPDDFFDMIYMDSVLEHVTQPLNYILKIKKILKPGGVVYIGVPNEDSLFNKVKFLVNMFTKKKSMSSKMNAFSSPYHINGFNKKSIEFFIRGAGFEAVEFRNFACRIEFLKYKFLSRDFIISLLLWPIYLLAIILRQEVYYEVILRKK